MRAKETKKKKRKEMKKRKTTLKIQQPKAKKQNWSGKKGNETKRNKAKEDVIRLEKKGKSSKKDMVWHDEIEIEWKWNWLNTICKCYSNTNTHTRTLTHILLRSV